MHSIPQFLKANTQTLYINLEHRSIISVTVVIIITMLPHVQNDLVFSKVDFTLSAINSPHTLHKLHGLFYKTKALGPKLVNNFSVTILG